MSDEDRDNGEEEGKRKRKRKHKSAADKEAAEGNEGDPKKTSQAITSSSSSGGGEGPNAYNNDRTIYIEGLPYAALEDDVRSFFDEVGGIAAVRLPRWHDSGNLRGYGHVVFKSSTLAEQALALDGKKMMNRYIKVARPMTPRAYQPTDKSSVVKPVGCKSVFVKNVPYDSTEDDVRAALSVCGRIASVRLPSWGHTSKLKGFCYVDFQREESAEIAVKKGGGLTIKGRPLHVDFETGAAKKGFKNLKVLGLQKP